MSDPPRRRWLSRSPNRSIIVDTEQVKLRVGWRAQLAALRWLLGPAVKVAIGSVAAAGVAWWGC